MDNNNPNYKPYQAPKPKKKRKNLLVSIITKVIFSPLIVFIIAYFYYQRDTRKALLASLLFFTVLTLISIVLKIFGIFTSAMTFRPLKFIKNSIDLVVMIISLILYWLLYSISFGANFTL